MGVSLFTFRLILKLLGVDDYGTYSAIGGVIIMFSFLAGAMTQATQRYLSFYLGKNDMHGLRRIFSMSVNTYMIFCLVILLLAETLGLWFVNTYMKFPTTSHTTVNIVYQFTIFTLMVQMMQLPYRSAIIAHEKMNFFAYLSVIEALMKLGVVGVLFLMDSHRLIGYVGTLFTVSVIVCLAHWYYTRRSFEACRYVRMWDRNMFRELTSFSGWNLLGSISNVGAQQGLDVLFNIFLGVVVNAAMGVTTQVCNAITSFVTNFQTAFNPQIIKLFASGNKEEFFTLIFRASRVSFILLFVLGLPVIVCCRPILNLWLTEVPEYSISFIQLMLIFSLIDALSGPLWTSAQASGNIRNYMLIMASLIFLNVPIAYLLLKLGYSPVYVITAKVIINFITHNVRILYLKGLIGFPVAEYYRKVMFPVMLAFGIAAPGPWILRNVNSGLGWHILIFAFALILAIVTSWFILLSHNERRTITDKLKTIRLKHR